MAINRSHKKDVKSHHQLVDLLREVRSSIDTNALIHWISSDSGRMELVAELASASLSNDPAFYKQIEATIKRSGLSVGDIQNRIRPVASALGIYSLETDENYYQVLGVNINATTKEIQSAYREKAYQIHPDTCSNHQIDENAFIILNTAYETLRDPTLRRKYDQKMGASGIWNEVHNVNFRSPNGETKKRNGKYYLLFGLIFILLCGGILISDVIVKRSAIEDLNSQYHREKSDTGQALDTTKATDPLTSKSENGSTQIQDEIKLDQGSDQGIVKDQVEREKPATLSKQPDVPIHVDKKIEPTEKASSFTPENEGVPQDIVESQTDSNLPIKTTEKKEEPETQQVKSLPPKKAVKSTSSRQSNSSTKKSITENLPDQLNASFDRYQKQITKTEQKALNGPSKDVSDKNEKTPINKKIDTSTKSLASIDPIDARTQIQMRSEIKPLDLIRNPPTKEALQTFLNRYTTAYQARREDQFFALFCPDFTENNKPFNEVVSLYRETFRDLENIQYQVRLLEYMVDLNDALIKIKGEYHLNWHSKQDGRQYSSKGRLAMDLVPEKGGGYKIKSLNY